MPELPNAGSLQKYTPTMHKAGTSLQNCPAQKNNGTAEEEKGGNKAGRTKCTGEKHVTNKTVKRNSYCSFTLDPYKPKLTIHQMEDLRPVESQQMGARKMERIITDTLVSTLKINETLLECGVLLPSLKKETMCFARET